MAADEVTYNDQSVSVDVVYEALLERIDWPGKYLHEIDGRGVSGVDSYLNSLGIERDPDIWQFAEVARTRSLPAADLPRCAIRGCALTEANHERGMAMIAKPDRHPFKAKKKTSS
jgi:hypothetical protein